MKKSTSSSTYVPTPVTNPSSKSKTIKAPGSNTTRVSVACDRCRKKKIRCFYDEEDGSNTNPNEKKQCSNCKSVGLDCIFTDKLARKAFPRGYTESLEERVRELEFENKKLQKLLSLKSANVDPLSPGDEMMTDATNNNNNNSNDSPSQQHDQLQAPQSNGKPRSENSVGGLKLNDENLNLLNQQSSNTGNSTANNNNNIHSFEHHLHDETCNCGMYPHSVHNRPVSIAGSVDIDGGELSDDDSFLAYPSSNNDNFRYTRNVDDLRARYGYDSFEQVNAPGAAATISLQNKMRTKNFMNLATLIATSIPRSTEETMFIPTLLAKIVSVHGFNSKAPFLTARSIALLKEAFNEEHRYTQFPISFKSVNFNKLTKQDSTQFFQGLNLPNHMNLDQCINLFFDTWNSFVPILNKEIFMTNYMKFNQSREQNFEDGSLLGLEKFGELLMIITALVMLSQERDHTCGATTENANGNGNGATGGIPMTSNADILQFYDHLIKQFIQSNINSVCSISSLQMTTMEFLYCLSTGDLNSSYELRGKTITMSQQLRLHRCPSAVLGANGSSVTRLQQGERRILFWSIYTLDSFSSFILGVPRLLKDYEIECALPSSTSAALHNQNENESDLNMVTFNNVSLTLAGKVCDSALGVMRYAKVMGYLEQLA
ncbi:unnamed protein product [Ambrosiozyma monospora]|uniref:Unnamed protein product n=1 Tax=Ambrosiozyma monospora TaxID=43982 RepID=A0ACB5SWY2_AMBMO|nr:unnamed protein product [Ambrosiozyma monospora]